MLVRRLHGNDYKITNKRIEVNGHHGGHKVRLQWKVKSESEKVFRDAK